MRVRGKRMAEWERAAGVAGLVTLAVSVALAVLAPDLGRPREGGGISARHGLGSDERARATEWGTRQLLALNTADLTRPGELRRIADSIATDSLRNDLVGDEKRSMAHPRDRLAGARVSTFLLRASGRGHRSAGDRDAGADWAFAMAVVRGTTAGRDGAPVPTVRRYDVQMVLTPEGWRFDYLNLYPGSVATWLVLTSSKGKPTDDMLFRREITSSMRVVLGNPPDAGDGRPTPEERRRRLTGDGFRRYSAWLARIGVRGGQADGSVARTEIIRRERDSAELLMFVNVTDPDPAPATVMVPTGDDRFRTIAPPARPASGRAFPRTAPVRSRSPWSARTASGRSTVWWTPDPCGVR
ncbi:hypothetical protein SAMN05443665_106428 [Actinomadura meyerae]|uniref:Uncharacterized protein n=1 Tax=Actinomadura meyerae TaxID=240840 RepID=A0A239P342_9ACTN|nr:hypothetical protein SAMN05443665_106428 [Actinomadura meyerae]